MSHPAGFDGQIVEDTDRGPVTISLDARLLRDRMLFLCEPLCTRSVKTLIQALFYLDSEGPDPIRLYIDAPGGEVSSGFALIDVMETIRAPVHTIVTGTAASMAALVAIAGSRGHRAALPHSWFMLHDVTIDSRERSGSGFLNQAAHVSRLRKQLLDHLHRHTGLGRRSLAGYLGPERWFNADEAAARGLIDRVIVPAEG